MSGLELGSWPGELLVRLTLGDGVHLVATSANGWAGPVTLVWGPDDGQWTEETSTLTDVGTVDGTEVSWTLTVAEVTARAAFPYVRLVDNGMTLKAGEVIPWTGGLGSTTTQTIASLTAGPPGPSAVSADADNVATLGTDGLIYVPPTDTGAFSDAAVAAFVDDTDSSTYASILAGFAATDDPRLSDARTPTAHEHLLEDITDYSAPDLSGYALTSSLGTAAAADADDFATAAQGDLADSALQVATPQPINAQTGTTYTAVSGDVGKLTTLTNASPIALTIATLPAGSRLDFRQGGAGAVTVAGSGVTLRAMPGMTLVSGGQYARFSVDFITSTEADVIGWMVPA